MSESSSEQHAACREIEAGLAVTAKALLDPN
jgi:hypothetical protein